MNHEQGITIREFRTVIGLMEDPFRYGGGLTPLLNYLDAWSKWPNLSPDLYPPKLRLTADMFKLPQQQAVSTPGSGKTSLRLRHACDSKIVSQPKEIGSLVLSSYKSSHFV